MLATDIHAIYGVALAAIQLSYLCAVVRLPVANLPVGASSDDLALVRTVADSSEHGVGKDHLTSNVASAGRRRGGVWRAGCSGKASVPEVPDDAGTISARCDALQRKEVRHHPCPLVPWTHLLVVASELDARHCSLVLLEGLHHVLAPLCHGPHPHLALPTSADEMPAVRCAGKSSHPLAESESV